MRRSILVSLLLLSACSRHTTDDGAGMSNSAKATDVNGSAKADVADTASQMGATSWTFTEPKVGLVTSSFDADGRFRAEHDGKIIEQGSWTPKDGKLCEVQDKTNINTCYTLAATMPAIGQSMTVSSDKGQRYDVKRVDYQSPKP